MTGPEASAAATANSVDDDIAALRGALAGATFRYNSEVVFHLGIEEALRAAGFDPHPEQKVTGGRIDFLVPVAGGRTVGIEVKIKGTARALAQQVDRYALDPGIDGFLIVTTRHDHRAVTGAAAGKPVRVLVVGGLS